MQKARTVFDIHENETDNDFSSRDFVRLLFKHKTVISGTFLVATFFAILIQIWLPPVYMSVAQILVKTEQQDTPAFFAGVTAQKERFMPDPVNRRMENEMEIIAAWSTIARTVQKLNLSYDQVYHSTLTHIIDAIMVIYEPVVGFFGVRKDPIQRGFDKTVQGFHSALIVLPATSRSSETNSNVFTVTYRTHDKLLARQSLETLIKIYLSIDIEENKRLGESALSLLNDRRNVALNRMKKAQTKLKSFLADTALPGSTLPVQLENFDAHQKNITMNENHFMVASGESSVIDVLRAHRTKLELMRTDFIGRFKEESPESKSLENRIIQINIRIRKEIKRNAENQYILVDLRRNLRRTEQQYLELDSKITKVQLFLDVNETQPTTRVVITPPITPLESNRKQKIFIAILASFGGLFFGVMIAGFREFINPYFRSRKDIVKFLNIEVIACIAETNDEAIRAALNPSAKAYKLNIKAKHG